MLHVRCSPFEFILKEEEACLKQELQGKQVGVIFDGTTRLGEAMAIILQFVGQSWTLMTCSNPAAFQEHDR